MLISILQPPGASTVPQGPSAAPGSSGCGEPGQPIIIGGAACRPGASQGSQIVATARASAAAPAIRPATGPHRQTFSVSTSAARPTITATFITPTALRITIKAQQQPRQYPPGWTPTRRSRDLPW